MNDEKGFDRRPDERPPHYRTEHATRPVPPAMPFGHPSRWRKIEPDGDFPRRGSPLLGETPAPRKAQRPLLILVDGDSLSPAAAKALTGYVERWTEIVDGLEARLELSERYNLRYMQGLAKKGDEITNRDNRIKELEHSLREARELIDHDTVLITAADRAICRRVKENEDLQTGIKAGDHALAYAEGRIQEGLQTQKRLRDVVRARDEELHLLRLNRDDAETDATRWQKIASNLQTELETLRELTRI